MTRADVESLLQLRAEPADRHAGGLPKMIRGALDEHSNDDGTLTLHVMAVRFDHALLTPHQALLTRRTYEGGLECHLQLMVSSEGEAPEIRDQWVPLGAVPFPVGRGTTFVVAGVELEPTVEELGQRWRRWVELLRKQVDRRLSEASSSSSSTEMASPASIVVPPDEAGADLRDLPISPPTLPSSRLLVTVILEELGYLAPRPSPRLSAELRESLRSAPSSDAHDQLVARLKRIADAAEERLAEHGAFRHAPGEDPPPPDHFTPEMIEEDRQLRELIAQERQERLVALGVAHFDPEDAAERERQWIALLRKGIDQYAVGD